MPKAPPDPGPAGIDLTLKRITIVHPPGKFRLGASNVAEGLYDKADRFFSFLDNGQHRFAKSDDALEAVWGERKVDSWSRFRGKGLV